MSNCNLSLNLLGERSDEALSLRPGEGAIHAGNVRRRGPHPSIAWTAKLGLLKVWCCVFLGLRKKVYVPTAGPSEPQALAVGLRRIVVPAHG
ncbi:hypothetical protein Pla52n_34790 [Stieleria varia]|uniref:Uncharacterized protein n=1 Tax=Stieleria varia TaxID=2528005 RepID=A0A5C6AT16_9BACT|nr:hypothetical protein Pla52n_34790 [Stieleria varia]